MNSYSLTAIGHETSDTMTSIPTKRTASMLRDRRGGPEMDDPEKRRRLEVKMNSETLLANSDPDPTSAEGEQVENTPYVYKPLATPHMIRIFRLYAGTGDEPLRGELVYTELLESGVNEDDVRRLEPDMARIRKMDEKAALFEEVEDLASHLQQYDRRATLVNPDETYCAFQDRNGIFSRCQYGWKPRLWIPYEALSYVWGDPTFSRTIHTPDDFIPVTPSLADALYHLRHPDKYRNMWIDALCINQEDLYERGHQVRGMGRVYASAEGVLVWLGPDALNLAAGNFTQLMASHNAYDSRRMDYRNYVENMNSLVRPIFQLDWFSRLWVVQELTLSRKALFCWGGAQIGHDDLYIAAIHGSVRTWLRELISSNLLSQLLRSTRALSCSDDRDRIYGLLGLLRTSDPLSNAVAELIPNYCQSVEDLFTNVACLMVEHESSAVLLTQADATLRNAASLPSWVPDWRLPETYHAFIYIDCSMVSAPDLWRSSLTVANRSTRILSIHGIRLDTILDFVLSPCHTDGLSAMLSAMTVVWIKLISTVPHQSLASGELALVRLLKHSEGFMHIRDTLSQLGYYLEARNVPVLSDATNSNYAVRAMARSILRVTHKVLGDCPEYFYNRPFATERDREGRKILLACSGLLGLGPAGVEAGDELVLFWEQHRPFLGIVRQDHEHHRFIGTAFVPMLCETGIERHLSGSVVFCRSTRWIQWPSQSAMECSRQRYRAFRHQVDPI